MNAPATSTSSGDWYRSEDGLLAELQSLVRPASSVAIRGYSDLVEFRRGGQGVVYIATQTATRRRVAIKIMLETGRTSAETRRRFEREIDLVASLNHPNIVRVFDGGVTDDGRNYCVMQFIDGVSLDELIGKDADGLLGAPRVVAALFAKIAEAVAFAHRRGVIHRDLKPSNVRIDPTGEPHVLDFGLAKPIGEIAAEFSMMSVSGQFMGSLPWASPEQAEGATSRIDVRTDVYSLGVVLFQMLTGQFPYSVNGNLSEVLDNIRNSEPLPPQRLRSAVDDELSTIVLKCLSKDPERRYQSAAELARDMRHYLAGEPIEAKRDSAWYALRKTMNRYRTAMRVGGAMLAVSIAASAGMGYLYLRATDAEKTATDRLEQIQAANKAESAARQAAQEEAARATKIGGFLDKTLRFVDPWKHPGRDITPMREMLDDALRRMEREFADDPAVEAALAATIGENYWTLGLFESSESVLRRAVALSQRVHGPEHKGTMHAVYTLASMLTEYGKHAESEKLLRELLATQRRVLPADDPAIFRTLNNLGYDIDWQGRVAEAAEYYQLALDGLRRHLGDRHAETLHTMNNLAIALGSLGKHDEGDRLFHEMIAGRSETLGSNHPETLQGRMNLAQSYVLYGRVAEGEKLLRELVPDIESALGERHPLFLSLLGNWASALGTLGKLDECAALEKRALEIEIATVGSDHPRTLHRKNQLVTTMIGQRRLEEALPIARDLVVDMRRVLGPDDLRTLTAAGNFAYLLNEKGDGPAAAAMWREIIANAENKLGKTASPAISAHSNLGGYLADQADWPAAEVEYRAAHAALVELKEESTWRAGTILGGLGRVLTESGKADEAESTLLESYRLLAGALGNEHERTRKVSGYLLRLYEKKGDAVRAAEIRANRQNQ